MPIEKIKSIFADSSLSESEIDAQINLVDHFEIARRLSELHSKEKIRVFQGLDADIKRQELLYETDQDSRLEIQESLEPDTLAIFLKDMPADEATDILQEHSEEHREEILEKMDPKVAGIIKDLITYEEETAGGMMVNTYNKVNPNQTAADILLNLRSQFNQDHPPYFYVSSSDGELLGYFKLRDLLNVPANAAAITFIKKKTPKVELTDSCEKVATIMDHEALSSLPVVDKNNILQGIVTFDDVIRMMQDIASEDIFTMVGTAKLDPFAKRTIRKVFIRMPWLLTTFVGGLISAFILATYQNILAEFATMILFIPFVLGLAGNVGLQGGTVIVRGLATGDIQEDNIRKVLRSELAVGLINGIVFGILCGGLIALSSDYIQNITPLVGLAVGVGIFLAVGFTTLMGSFMPMVFIKLKIDPAISIGPFVTIANDIIGLFIYLTTATLLFSSL
jgi:magnesium transporter